ncbi:MAG: discoidin domain-containing protein [Isosphaeraceae bacterium]
MRRRPQSRTVLGTLDPLEPRTLLSTLIALIDSGVDLSATADSAYYDFTWAYDAYNKRTAADAGNQVVQDTSLQHGHGSTVADAIIGGINAARSQPGAGQVDVKIMPIRDTSSGLSIDSNALIRGVYWAADHGADVINLSVNYNGDPVLRDGSDPHHGSTLSQAIAYAQTRGAVVVTGAGNSGLDLDRLVVFPPYSDNFTYSTARPLPGNLLVSAAVDPSGKLTPASNWGPTSVDLGAYGNAEGVTSYSAGFVSGVAGVIAALLPPDRRPADVIGVITQTVTPRDQGVGEWSTTGGVIDPAAAVARVMADGVHLESGGVTLPGVSGDAYFQGGKVYSVDRPIDVSQVPEPAPQQVYQTERYGDFTYTIPTLLPDRPYTLRLDFAEIYWDGPNMRAFNVRINGDPVLTSFDVFAAAGGKDRAISREFECHSDAFGKIVLEFTTLRDNAKVSGISMVPAADLARGKAVTSSTVEGPGYAPGFAVDGDPATRWSSGQWMQPGEVGWIAVDLGARYEISGVRLNWETAYAVNYQIQVSDDGSSWTTIQDVSGNAQPGAVHFAGLSGSGRLVRIYCTQTSAGSDNYSLYEFQVYGLAVQLTDPAPAGDLLSIDAPVSTPATTLITPAVAGAVPVAGTSGRSFPSGVLGLFPRSKWSR